MFEIATVFVLGLIVTMLYGIAFVITELWSLLVKAARRILCSRLQRLNWFR